MKPGRYGPFPYSPGIRRPPLKWPNGAHVAPCVVPNIEFFALDKKVPFGHGRPSPFRSRRPHLSATGNEIASHYRAQPGQTLNKTNHGFG
jgi:hypothetical protein